jgi:hypothetical protein
MIKNEGNDMDRVKDMGVITREGKKHEKKTL